MGSTISGITSPAALYQHPISNADVLAVDVVFIVQSGPAYCYPADIDRFEYGEGIEAAGPAHIYPYIEQLRRSLYRREFVSYGPARVVADGAQFLLEGDGVDLDDNAVDIVGQLFALVRPAMKVFFDFIDVAAVCNMRVDLKSQGL